MPEARPARPFASNSLLPGLILIAGFALTWLAWDSAQQDVVHRLQAEFASRVNEIIVRIEDRLKVYEQALLGTEGLFNASDSVNRQEFRRYADTLHLQSRYPGIYAVSHE